MTTERTPMVGLVATIVLLIASNMAWVVSWWDDQSAKVRDELSAVACLVPGLLAGHDVDVEEFRRVARASGLTDEDMVLEDGTMEIANTLRLEVSDGVIRAAALPREILPECGEYSWADPE